ncbi:amidohydrolase [Rhodocytophaga aerolata]|uniref:Amidohydrolase n=1 Tax=Rhodocytophaga aerolata TaxID=455078 RepID=A0ABT8R215_9BACT|nr:amidohydrolase [Rhodocytophaga aerolata]MDO1445676.1 amidohydrolase [Rhodocytophaga aerolata]
MNKPILPLYKPLLAVGIVVLSCSVAAGQSSKWQAAIAKQADKLEPKVIEWRRDFHEHPELSNREFKTAEKVAAHLKALGIEVKTGIAHTGVVGILKGGKPGPVIALRADMDGLPVTERVNLPFASKAKGEYNGQPVGVMHACGHDTHVAMLMGAAEILAGMRNELKGTVKFIFQPAEEGAPSGEKGGASLMVEEGVLENPKVDVVFGLHINSLTEVGKLKYRPEGTMASSDGLRIKVKGKQVHGAYPWDGVDPIAVSAQIINGLQTIVSRQTELIQDAAVVTIGSIHGGVRGNIIPEEVEMVGTIRALNVEMQKKIHEKIKLTATKIAESAGATAEVDITIGNPVTYNDPTLTSRMVPTLEAVAGKENVILTRAVTGAEDFAFYQQKVPGLFVFVGGMPKGKNPSEAAPHHTPDFFIDESGMKLGVKTLCQLTLDYMEGKNGKVQ